MHYHLPASHPVNNFKDIEAVGLVLYILGKHRRAIAQTSTVDKWPNTDGIIDLTSVNGELIGRFDVQIKKLPDNHNMVFDLDVEYLAYCDQTASEPTLTLLVDTVNEKVYWFHVTREWIQRSNFLKNKTRVRIQLNEAHSFDRLNKAYLDHWENIIREVQRRKNLLQQLLDYERGNREMHINLLDAQYSPILTNIKMNVLTHEKLKDGSTKFVMANTYSSEEMVFINVDIHLTSDLRPTVTINMTPMRRESALHNLMYFKCLSRLRNGEVFFLADNYSDFWCSGKVSYLEEVQKNIEQNVEFAKTVVNLERRINQKLPLGIKEITEEELNCVEELFDIVETGVRTISMKGKGIKANKDTIDLNTLKSVDIDKQVVRSEIHWRINLGRKVLLSSRPFKVKGQEDNEIYLEADPEGICVFIFEEYYDGEYTDVFKGLE
ncbi:DUF4365 domain-containing protein [Peribacillus frigoritolerans]|uniref:DUF4365 domain-containing protein n=1 Tax=Peribacillus castrilensis TaxID=2897690 RepID=UPI002DCDF0D4|nr:DUF4365 domain-containing protein [Peribacillus castrilensis]